MRKNTSTCLRVRKVCCLCDQVQKELFAPSFCAFIAPHSRWELPQTLPVCGKAPEELILKRGHPPTLRRGVQGDLGCCTSEPVAAGSPLFVPAQCRLGSKEDAIPLIPAGGINRHRQAAALPQPAAELQRLCRQSSSEQCPPMAGSIPILRSY